MLEEQLGFIRAFVLTRVLAQTTTGRAPMRSLKATASGRKSSGAVMSYLVLPADVDVGCADKGEAFSIGGGLGKAAGGGSAWQARPASRILR